MTTFHSLILGFVEGMTEFLPISSTGHMILTSHALGIENDEFLKLFEIVIQTGAILAVLFIYWKELWAEKKEYAIKLAIAFLPTAILGFLFLGFIKKHLFMPIVVCSALFVGGFVLIFLEQIVKNFKTRELDYKRIFYLGLFQCLAFVPGVSRSAATILGGRLLGASMKDAVRFSFLLAIPTILSASAYSMLKVNYVLSGNDWQMLAVGLATSFIFGYLSVTVFLKWLNHQTFIMCGIYRIIIAVIYYAIFIR